MKVNTVAAVRPYEDSLPAYSTMYDRMPYVWDTDLNIERVYRKVTGNVIKAHRCRIEEPIEVKHK